MNEKLHRIHQQLTSSATLLLSFLLLSAFAMAQTGGRISGQVQESAGKGVNGATVTLLKATDSSLVKAAVSDRNGHYELENIKEGRYLLSITSVGFDKHITPAFDLAAGSTVQAPAVTLTTAAQGLSGVTVTARRPLIENRIDKMVVNVDASPTNAGASALEVLEK